MPIHSVKVSSLILLSSLCGWNASAADVAKPIPSPSYQSYLAHIAAANHALRNNDTAEVQRWLAQAPSAHRAWEWHYLQRQSSQAESILRLQDATASSLQVSPDGLTVAIVATDKTVQMRELASGVLRWQFFDPALQPQAVAFHPHQPWLAAAFSKHTVKLWNSADGKELRQFQGAGKGITAIAFSPDGAWLASASWNRSAERGVWGIVEIWDVATGALIQQLEYGEKPLVSIAFSPNGKYLAVGSWEVQKTVAVWDVVKAAAAAQGAQWQAPKLFASEADEQYKAVQSISFSPDSQQLAAGGKDGRIRIWDIATQQRVHTLGGRGWGHSKWVNSIAFSPDGQRLVSASTDQTLRVWDVRKGTEEAVLLAHTKSVNAVSFDPQARFMLSAGAPEVKRWNADSWQADKQAVQSWKHPASVYGIALSADGKFAYTAAWQGGIKVWDTEKNQTVQEWAAHQSSANAVSVNAKQDRLASVGNDGKLKIWQRTGTGYSFQEYKNLEQIKGQQLIAVDLSRDGKRVFAASQSGAAKLWDIDSGKVLFQLEHEKNVSSTAMSAQERYLATGGSDGSVKIWDASNGKLLHRFHLHQAGIAALSFSPDQQSLVAASHDKSISFMPLTGKAKPQKILAHDEGIFGIAFSPDGQRVVSASADQTVKLWDTKNATLVFSLSYESPVYAARFSADGKTLYTLPMDGTVRILRTSAN